MSITDELREIIPEIDFATNRDRLRAIADLIDMKHELGRGTCEPVDGYDDDGEEIGTCCSECGSPWPVYYVVRYCPVCGCKVVDDASVD